MKNKYCVLCVKNYLMKFKDDVTVEILPSRNFGKWGILSYFE